MPSFVLLNQNTTLYTLSGRRGLHIGYHITKGVSERCIARLLLTVLIIMALFPIINTLAPSYCDRVIWVLNQRDRVKQEFSTPALHGR